MQAGMQLEWCLSQERLARQSKRYKDMLLDWIEKTVDEVGARAVSQLTREKWPKAQLQTRRLLYQALGLDPLPPRVPLPCARLVGTLEREDYTVERLVLEPRSNFLMPAHLYLPKKARLPAPAVLYAPGHWMIYGKTEPDIQACCIGLAKLGFVVMVFDPIGQGERGATFEDHARADLLLSGLSQEGLMAWESMRAIDYLLTRPEVDGNHIGMTGASGGGLNTIYTCAADERIAVSVPVCYVTSFSRFLRAMRGLNWNNCNDLCNQVPNVIRDAEMAGLCGLIYPRPLLIINGWLDPQFPVAGAQEVVDQLQDIYQAVGLDRLRLTAIQADHGYDREMRQAAYGWFQKWLQGKGNGDPVPEPELVTEPPDSEELKCFLGTSSIRSWHAIRQLSRQASRSLPDLQLPKVDPASWGNWVREMQDKLHKCLGVITPEWQNIAASSEERIDGAERVLLSPEPDVVNPAYLIWPENTPVSKAVIYFSDEGKLGGLGAGFLSAVVETGSLAMAIDPRGLGETAPLPPPVQTVATLDGKLAQKITQEGETLEFEAATDLLMLGRSLFGQQVFDVLHALRFIRQRAPDSSISLVGSGPICSLLALYCAALSSDVSAVVADRLLPSYHLLIEEDRQVFPITAYVFGILRIADIPHIAAMIAPRHLVITHPLGADLQDMDVTECSSRLAWTFKVYQQLNARLPDIFGEIPIRDLVALIQ